MGASSSAASARLSTHVYAPNIWGPSAVAMARAQSAPVHSGCAAMASSPDSYQVLGAASGSWLARVTRAAPWTCSSGSTLALPHTCRKSSSTSPGS